MSKVKSLAVLAKDEKVFFSPRDIAKNGWIVSRNGEGNYERVLKLIRSGRLESVNYSTGKKKMYRVYAWQLVKYLQKYESLKLK